jgi:hypothetical protein
LTAGSSTPGPASAWPSIALQRDQLVVLDTRTAQQIGQVVLAFDGLADHAFGFGSRQDARVDPGRTQAFQLHGDGFALALEGFPLRIADHAQLAADFRQAHVGIVFAQRQAVFRAAGEHAVGLGHALGGEVVDQHAKIGFRAARGPGCPCPGSAAPR